MAGKAVSSSPPSEKKPEMNPDSIPKVVWLIGKSFVTSIPKQIIWIALKSIAIFLFIMWLNFYVIGVRNAGYGGGPVIEMQQKPWVWLFNVGANKAAFSMLSFLAPLILTSLWAQIRSLGIGKFFKNLFHVFHWTGYCAVNAGRHTLPVLLFSMAALMPIGFLTQNTGLFITIAVGQFFGYIAQNRNLVFLFSRAGWMDFQRMFRGKQPIADLNPGIGGLISLGLFLGAIFLVLLPPQFLRIASILLFLLFTGLGVFSKIGKPAPKAVAGLLLFIGLNLLWFRLFGRVFADDAGYDELGNNMGNYIRDPGGQMVIKEGVQPGLLGVLGSWIGSAVGSVADAGLYVGGKVVDGAKYVGGKVVDGAQYVGGKVVDGAKYVGGKVVDGVKYVGETVVDVTTGTVGVIKDLNNPEIWGGMWEGIEKDVTEAEGQIADAWETTKDIADKVKDAIATAGADAADAVEAAIKDVWNNPGVYVETLINGTLDTLKETLNLGHEILTNPQIIVDTLTGTVKDLVGIGGKVVSVAGTVISTVASGIWTTITDPQKAWDFIKNSAGYENFVNSLDPNRGLLSRIGQSLTGSVKLAMTVFGVKTIVAAGSKIATTGVTQTIKTMGDDVAGLLGKGKTTGGLPPAPKFGVKGIADTSHMNPAQLKKFQELVKKFGIDEATIRFGGSKRIMQQMTNGHVLPKGHDIMNKTMNGVDKLLGGPKNANGLAAHFKPTLPSLEDMRKMKPDNLQKVWNRYLQRLDEFNAQKGSIEKLSKPLYDKAGNLVRGPKITVDPNGIIRDAATGKPFGSDWDLGHLLKNGKQIPRTLQNAFIDQCKKAGLPVEHGSLADWVNMNDFQKEAYGKMIRGMMKEGVISVGPDGAPTHKILQEFVTAVRH